MRAASSCRARPRSSTTTRISARRASSSSRKSAPPSAACRPAAIPPPSSMARRRRSRPPATMRRATARRRSAGSSRARRPACRRRSWGSARCRRSRPWWRRPGLKLSDIDRFEINEAFGAQVMACARALDLDEDKLNVNGGAIAIGHPLGATGVRLSVTVARELQAFGLALRHRVRLHWRRAGHRAVDREHRSQKNLKKRKN